jgi:succinate-acetate transporter protein
MNHPIHDTMSIATNGIVGVLSSVFAVLTTFQEQLEWGVRVTGGFLGIIVAGITIYNLLKNKKRD